jgi:hypothetical protein
MQTPPKTASEPESTEALKCPKLARPKRLKRTLSVAFPEELDITDKVEAKAEEATNELPDPTVSDYAKAEARYAAMDETAKDEAAKAEDAKAEDAKAEDAKAEAVKTDNEATAFAADFVATLYAHNFVDRIMSVLRGKRISPDALIALCDELEDLPQVDMATSTTPYDRAVKHMLMMDKLRDAALKARSKAWQTWDQSKWNVARVDNGIFLNDLSELEDGTRIKDACAICAVSKSECVNSSEHFGFRGESPPDVVCKQCGYNAGNFYDVRHVLFLHVDKKHKSEQATQAV